MVGSQHGCRPVCGVVMSIWAIICEEFFQTTDQDVLNEVAVRVLKKTMRFFVVFFYPLSQCARGWQQRVGLLLSIGPNTVALNCRLFQHQLAFKGVEPDLHSVLNTALTAVNLVKLRLQCFCLFGQLCVEKDAGHDGTASSLSSWMAVEN